MHLCSLRMQCCMSAHASQAFSTYTSARDCTDSEHLPLFMIIVVLFSLVQYSNSIWTSYFIHIYQTLIHAHWTHEIKIKTKIRKRCIIQPLQCKLTTNFSWVDRIPPIRFIRKRMKCRSKVFSKTSRCSRTLIREESIQNLNTVALRVVFSFSLPKEFAQFVDIARLSHLER